MTNISPQVGLIIGRGGESIKDLQNKAGCRMQMIQEGMYANAPEKPLKMIGSPQAILKAKVFRFLLAFLSHSHLELLSALIEKCKDNLIILFSCFIIVANFYSLVQELVNELLKDDVIGRMNGSAYVSLLNSQNYEATQHVPVPKDLVG